MQPQALNGRWTHRSSLLREEMRKVTEIIVLTHNVRLVMCSTLTTLSRKAVIHDNSSHVTVLNGYSRVYMLIPTHDNIGITHRRWEDNHQ